MKKHLLFYPLILYFFLTPALAQEWPGMGPRVSRLAQHLVSTAKVVLVKKPGEPVRNVWVKTTRRYIKPNGWFGLEINGQVIEEKYIYLPYGESLENLQALFTLGSGLIGELEVYRLEDFGDQEDRPPKIEESPSINRG